MAISKTVSCSINPKSKSIHLLNEKATACHIPSQSEREIDMARLRPNPIAHLGDDIPRTRKDFQTRKSPTWLEPNPERMDQGNTRSEAIIKQIKKLQKRIKKAQAFVHGPERPESAELRLKVLKWESMVNRYIGYLQEIQRNSLVTARREISKFENRQGEENLTQVKLENGKLRARIPPAEKMNTARQKAEEAFKKIQNR
jgi:hypothetical protein